MRRSEPTSSRRQVDTSANESRSDEFVAAVAAALEVIGANPEAWAMWPDIRQDDPPIRRYVMPRFPYVIGFQVFADHVLVVVIAYAGRRPGYWR
jgi:plasmid stabilization system protein ParE